MKYFINNVIECGKKMFKIYLYTLKNELVLGVFKKEKIHDNGNENRIEGREGGIKNRKTTVLSIYEIARFPFA